VRYDKSDLKEKKLGRNLQQKYSSDVQDKKYAADEEKTDAERKIEDNKVASSEYSM
jgi:hypothetical protein